MNQKNIEYKKMVDVMTRLLDLDAETKRKVSSYIKNAGIKIFFLNLESFDLPGDVLMKFQDLKAVIEVLDGDIANLDFNAEGGDV